jgi:S-formylglutathione hydrolase FrmB
MIMVFPDGQTGSWYFDSPIDPAWKFETYISSELVGWMDKNYRTIHDRKGRAITGLSMGGHGAMFLAFRHQDVFGAAGSMSGGVDFRPFPTKWDIAKRLGPYEQNQERWTEYTAITQLDKVKSGSLSLIIDCGYSDFFFDVNKSFHEKLLLKGIEHDFIVRPGAHNWKYWQNSIAYQVFFMSRFFNQN